MKEISVQKLIALAYLLSDAKAHSKNKILQVLPSCIDDDNQWLLQISEAFSDWGIELIVENEGTSFRFAEPLDLLDKSELTNALPLHQIMLFPVIDSTNQYLLTQFNKLPNHTVCFAEYQQAGRGRRGRRWFSPFGANLYFSYYWQMLVDGDHNKLLGLSSVVGLVIAQTLRQLGAADIKVKWPNDLYWRGKKLGGILVEMVPQRDQANIVIGVGLNMAMKRAPTDIITQDWCCLEELSLKPVLNKSALTIMLIDKLAAGLTRFQQDGTANFVEIWQQYDHFLNQPVRLSSDTFDVEGIARGINHQGALLLENQDGITAYFAGEMSLRGAPV